MAIIEYPYEEVPHEALVEALRWLQNHLNLRDWEITLDTGSRPPKGFNNNGEVEAQTIIKEEVLKAEIWLDISAIRGENHNPTQALCHEVLHILTEGLLSCDAVQGEALSRRLEAIVYEAYKAKLSEDAGNSRRAKRPAKKTSKRTRRGK